jgi:hypothetical protein
MNMPVDQINHPFSPETSPIPPKTSPVVHGYPLVGVLPKLLINPLQFMQRVTLEHPGEVVALNIGPLAV